MKKYNVTEIFTVGIRIEDIEAENEEQAQDKFLEITDKWSTDTYAQAVGDGAGDSEFQIEESE